MCDPVSLALTSFAVGGAQSIAGYEQQSVSAERQNEYYKANEAAAQQALVNQYAGDQQQMLEQRQQASQQAFDDEKKTSAAEGTAIAGAGGAGVAGSSVGQLINAYAMRENNTRMDIDTNFKNQAGYDNAVETSQYDATLGRINSVQTAVPPSFLSAGLGILGAGVGAAGQYYRDDSLARGAFNPGMVSANLGGIQW